MGLDIQIPPNKREKPGFFCKNHGRFGPDPVHNLHGVILWYSPRLILDTARSQKSVVYLGGDLTHLLTSGYLALS